MKKKLKKAVDIINFLCWVEAEVEGAVWEDYPKHLYVGKSYIGGLLEEYPEYYIADEQCGGDQNAIKNLTVEYKLAGSPDGYCDPREVFYL